MTRNYAAVEIPSSRMSEEDKDFYQPIHWNHPLVLNLFGTTSILTVPLYRTPDQVGDASVITLVRTFGVHVMRIYNALLLRQRVLFVGRNACAASEICHIVLSAVALISPPIPNVIRRAFPYASLSDLSFLQVYPPLRSAVLGKVSSNSLYICECFENVRISYEFLLFCASDCDCKFARRLRRCPVVILSPTPTPTPTPTHSQLPLPLIPNSHSLPYRRRRDTWPE